MILSSSFALFEALVNAGCRSRSQGSVPQKLRNSNLV